MRLTQLNPDLKYANLIQGIRLHVSGGVYPKYRGKPMMSGKDANPKLTRGGKRYATLSLSLAPADMSGIDVCPMRSVACTKGCLGHNSGHSCMGKGASNDRTVMTVVRSARIRRTHSLFSPDVQEVASAIARIEHEIGLFYRWCIRNGVIPCVRMNAFSDLVWELYWGELFSKFPMVQFYDYTKIPSRLYRSLPGNYHLTLSRSEDNEVDCVTALRQGKNVAVVFAVEDPKDIPPTWVGYTVHDGTVDDRTFEAPKGTVRGLSWKGCSSKVEYARSLADALSAGFAVSVH